MIPVIGLGNPGNEYEMTRHNIGFRILDALSKEFEYDKYLLSEKSILKIGDETVMLLKPQTFMNESGKVLDGIKRIDPYAVNKIIVVHDEIDLPLGAVKIAYDRGDGGHNGIKSINKYFGGKDYTRVRIGISKMGENNEIYKPNVLGKFSEEDANLLPDIISRAAYAIKKIITEGKDAAAIEVNRA